MFEFWLLTQQGQWAALYTILFLIAGVWFFFLTYGGNVSEHARTEKASDKGKPSPGVGLDDDNIHTPTSEIKTQLRGSDDTPYPERSASSDRSVNSLPENNIALPNAQWPGPAPAFGHPPFRSAGGFDRIINNRLIDYSISMRDFSRIAREAPALFRSLQEQGALNPDGTPTQLFQASGRWNSIPDMRPNAGFRGANAYQSSQGGIVGANAPYPRPNVVPGAVRGPYNGPTVWQGPNTGSGGANTNHQFQGGVRGFDSVRSHPNSMTGVGGQNSSTNVHQGAVFGSGTRPPIQGIHGGFIPNAAATVYQGAYAPPGYNNAALPRAGSARSGVGQHPYSAFNPVQQRPYAEAAAARARNINGPGPNHQAQLNPNMSSAAGIGNTNRPFINQVQQNPNAGMPPRPGIANGPSNISNNPNNKNNGKQSLLNELDGHHHHHHHQESSSEEEEESTEESSSEDDGPIPPWAAGRPVPTDSDSVVYERSHHSSDYVQDEWDSEASDSDDESRERKRTELIDRVLEGHGT